LFLLSTGARPEEIAQLLVSDFSHDEQAGCWMMTITDKGDHPVKGKRTLKSSDRTFSIPPLLLELGLADYLARLRAEGETALFPRLSVKNKSLGYLIPSIGEWWSAYLRDQGLELTKVPGKTRRPLRDFRPTWTTAARESGVPEEAISYLMGHSNARAVTTSRYGSREAYGQFMERIAFNGLDMSMVRRWAPKA
jgi:integrase